MRIAKMIFVCVCLVGLTQLGWGQSAPMGTGFGARNRGIPGYFDPETGTFTTKAQSFSAGPEAGQEPTTTNILARLIYNFTIGTDVPTTDVTVCTVTLSVFDTAGSYTERASGIATKSGTACTATLLFSWPLNNPNTDMVAVSYSLLAFQAFTVGGSTTVQAGRESDHSLPSISVPLNGSTTTVAVSAEM